MKKEEEKWRCPDCGGVICCHNGLCLDCNLGSLSRNKKISLEPKNSELKEKLPDATSRSPIRR